MSVIFISYSSSDRERIQTLVKALEQKGWSVWWDRTIPPGEIFYQVIEKALGAAKCVIVVWSKESVKSEWVINEADIGRQRRILVPVLIDDVKIPFGFSHIQAASLVDWQGTLPHPGFDQLSDAVARIISHSPGRVTPSVQEQETEVKKQKEAERLEQERQEREAREKAAREEAKRKAREERQRQEQIATLYEQALGLIRLQQWQQALEKMKEIRALDPQFADSEGITAKAQEELARETKRLEQEYREREAREKAAKEEAEREAREEHQRQEQATNLYEKARTLANIQQWRQALEKIKEIQALDPEFEDREGIAARAQEELKKKAGGLRQGKERMVLGVGIIAVIIAAIIVYNYFSILPRDKEEIATLKTEVEELTKDKSELQKTVDDLTNQVNTLKIENDQLKSQLQGSK